MSLIFLIEDNDSLRENTQTLLELQGYDVKSFASGERAVEALEHNQPDLVLCDVLMDGMTGYDLLERFRAHPHTATVPFVLISALAERDQVRKGMTLGADDYLTKPFTSAALLATVKARLKHSETVRRLSFLQSMQVVQSRKLNSMPHELRTPLNGIIGGIDLLRESLADQPEHLELVEIISSSADRLERTLLNYLFYLTITSGRHQCPDQEHFDLSKRVEHMALEVANRYLRRDDLLLHLQPSPVDLCPVCFHRVLTELLDNAFKFSMSCEMIVVNSGWREEDQSWFVTIRDHGVSMKSSEIDNISVFRQFDRKLREQQGMGLGLALSMALASGHGWNVAIHQPVDGVGLIAALTIPKHRCQHPSSVCSDDFSRIRLQGHLAEKMLPT